MINEDRVEAAMHAIERRKGHFWLFGMFMRTEAPGAWDLVAYAPWLEEGQLKAVSAFVRMLSQSIGEDSLKEFRRIATLTADSEFLKFMLENIPTERVLRFRSSDLWSRGIEDAIIFRSMKPADSSKRV
jgi:hypothetical protein